MEKTAYDLIDELKAEAKKIYPNFDPYEAMGYVIGDYCTNGNQICKLAGGALENANFHKQAETVRSWINQ